MFELDAVDLSSTERAGGGLWSGEVVASFGLLVVIFGVVRSGRTAHVAYAVGAYITAAYWFTSSTSFANPAITLARTLTDTFAGIAPSSVPVFIGMQLLGGALGVAAVLVLYPRAHDLADDLTRLSDRQRDEAPHTTTGAKT
jgi:arsenate reductase